VIVVKKAYQPLQIKTSVFFTSVINRSEDKKRPQLFKNEKALGKDQGVPTP
tara:strand:- start:3020 stop:3172 length:153 start_codon:yes stop_codon:yes gene_type:complete